MSSDNEKKKPNIFDENSLFSEPIFKEPLIKKEDPYLEIISLSKKLANPFEFIIETHFPKFKIHYPKKWNIRPNDKTFKIMNEKIEYKDDIFTYIITKKRNNIEMLYDPVYETVTSIAPRLAYIGYYIEDLSECETERHILFLHPNQKYFIMRFKNDLALLYSDKLNPNKTIEDEGDTITYEKDIPKDDNADNEEEEEEEEKENKKEKSNGFWGYFFNGK
jgi:hypothetical protein